MGDQQTHHVTTARPDLDKLDSQLAEWRDELLRLNGEQPTLPAQYQRGRIESDLASNLARVILYARTLEAERDDLRSQARTAQELIDALADWPAAPTVDYRGPWQCVHCGVSENEYTGEIVHKDNCVVTRARVWLDGVSS